jgi:hypothetical protein
MVAPEGYWEFNVLTLSGIDENIKSVFSTSVYPNPSHGITCIPFNTERQLSGKIFVTDVLGKTVQLVHEGDFKVGKSNYFINSCEWAPGIYSIVAETNEGTSVQKLMVK